MAFTQGEDFLNSCWLYLPTALCCIKDTNVQVSDTTKFHICTAARYIKKFKGQDKKIKAQKQDSKNLASCALKSYSKSFRFATTGLLQHCAAHYISLPPQ
jgi:hypothetical protein